MAHSKNLRNVCCDDSDDDDIKNRDNNDGKNIHRRGNVEEPGTNMPIPVAPAGLKAMYTACRRIYPDQPNPLQVTAIVKYWFGGPDPLDYISMYRNSGESRNRIPPHWHYISFGLSDLHGDGRVHKFSGPDQPSGYGFELSFRLKMDSSNSSDPPLWPATLLQSLARYIFSSGNTLCVGDHIPWRTSLDGGSTSLVQNMVMSIDPQLELMNTEFGTVNFLQVVGVLKDELKAVQWWRGLGVLDLMKTVPQAGGSWLVTDMNRCESMFDINPSLRDILNEGILNDGSNLSGVSGRCCWKDQKLHYQSSSSSGFTMGHSSNISTGLKSTTSSGERVIKNIKSHYSIHMTLDLDSAILLHLALKGRLKHGRHFTYKNVMNDCAITLVTGSVEGAFATKDEPFVSNGNWLQVLLDGNFMDDILEKCGDLMRLKVTDLPRSVSWLSRGLTLTVVNA